MEKSLAKDREREQLIGMCVRQKLETRSMLETQAYPSEQISPPWKEVWIPRALCVGVSVGLEGTNIALLSGLLTQLLFPMKVGHLCIQGQKETGKKCDRALYRERE